MKRFLAVALASFALVSLPVAAGVSNAVTCTITGTPGNDPDLQGTEGNDIICGLGGDDVISGNGGTDVIYGGAGADVIVGNDDSDVIYGGLGRDVIYGGDGINYLYGGGGNDELHGGSQADFMYGGNGSDILNGEVGDDSIRGGIGRDAIFGSFDNDVMHGEGGNDFIDGGGGNDYATGGPGTNYCTSSATESVEQCGHEMTDSEIKSYTFQSSTLDVSVAGKEQTIFFRVVNQSIPLQTVTLTIAGQALGQGGTVDLYAQHECTTHIENNPTASTWGCRMTGNRFTGRYKLVFEVPNTFRTDRYVVSAVRLVDYDLGITDYSSADLRSIGLNAGFDVTNSCITPTSRSHTAGC